MTGVFIFVIVYLLSLASHILWVYFENKRHLYTVGDIIDDLEFYMWFPVLNTISLFSFVVALAVITLIDLLRIDKAWDWFRNIKIK